MGSKFETRLLGELCHEITVGFVGTMTNEYIENGIPFLRSKNIDEYDVKWDDMKYVSSEFHKKLSKSALKPGDVAIVRTGKPGTTCVIPNDLREANCSDIVIARVNNELLCPHYLSYFMNAMAHGQVNAHIVGAVQQHFNVSSAKKLEIPLPSRVKQIQIVQVLKTLDDKLKLNRQINQTLEQMAQTLFKSWFVDFDPVIDNALDAGFFEQDLVFSDELLHRVEVRKAVRESDNFKPLSEDIRRLFPDAFEECVESALGLGGWVPEGWTISALDKIANFQNGLALQKFRPDSENDEYLPVLKIAQLRQGYCDANEKAKVDIIESCRVYNGDMIFSWSGTLMIDIWTGGDAALNQHLFKVTSKNYPLSFYYHWTNHHLARFQHIAAAKAVTMGHIKRGDLSSSYCVVPTTQVLSYFDSITGSYLEQAKSVRLQCNSLTKLRDTLLPKLISGELSLCDIKIDIPEETLI